SPTAVPVDELHRRADAALTAVIDAVDAQGWASQTPCEEWTARDLVAHVIGTERQFLEGRGVDVGDEPDTSGDPAAAWQEHRATIMPVVTDPEFLATPYDGYFGPTTVAETWERFYLFDMVVHRWDLATAVGRDERFGDDELDRIEAGVAAMGDSIYMEGVCQPGVEPAEGADRQARLLARMGRRASTDAEH
ncbi:MAG: TIGR03086 family metal-binding protein, partial [Microthrixaceae bacterium]